RELSGRIWLNLIIGTPAIRRVYTAIVSKWSNICSRSGFKASVAMPPTRCPNRFGGGSSARPRHVIRIPDFWQKPLAVPLTKPGRPPVRVLITFLTVQNGGIFLIGG